jgi:hypothetical protein
MKATVHIDPSAFRAVIMGRAQRDIKDAVHDLKARILESFASIKSGKPGRFRRASAVGEAPAIQSGKLFRSLKESFPNALTGVLLIDTEYAAILEEKLGRPYYTPAIENLAERFETNLSGRFS